MVLSEGEIDFMNDFSSKVLRYIHKMNVEDTKEAKDGQNMNKQGGQNNSRKDNSNLLNRKIFYLFENDKD